MPNMYWMNTKILIFHLELSLSSICHFPLQLLASGWHICLSAQKVFRKTNREQTGPKNHGCGSGRKCVGMGVNLCSILTSLILSVQFTSIFAFLVCLLACLRIHGA